jgi:hypothetical protein
VIGELKGWGVHPQRPAQPSRGPVQQLPEPGQQVQPGPDHPADGLDLEPAIRVQQAGAIQDGQGADVPGPAEVVPPQGEQVISAQAFHQANLPSFAAYRREMNLTRAGSPLEPGQFALTAHPRLSPPRSHGTLGSVRRLSSPARVVWPWLVQMGWLATRGTAMTSIEPDRLLLLATHGADDRRRLGAAARQQLGVVDRGTRCRPLAARASLGCSPSVQLCCRCCRADDLAALEVPAGRGIGLYNGQMLSHPASPEHRQ